MCHVLVDVTEVPQPVLDDLAWDASDAPSQYCIPTRGSVDIVWRLDPSYPSQRSAEAGISRLGKEGCQDAQGHGNGYVKVIIDGKLDGCFRAYLLAASALSWLARIMFTNNEVVRAALAIRL